MKQFLYLIIGLTFYSSSLLASGNNKSIWLLVDTTKLILEIKQGDKTLHVMENISIGRNGAGFKRRRGDDITPIGIYRIGWINEKSSFRKFYGFTYPSIGNADEALTRGLVNQKTHSRIVSSHKNNRLPPQNTPMGGRIGIHGLGFADKKIHKMMNWTHGCIALTNEQIDQLDPWIHTGMKIKIK